MGAADMMLLTLLALADVCLLIHLHRRRERRMKVERMMRALRGAIRREVGVETKPVRAASATTAAAPSPALVLQRAS